MAKRRKFRFLLSAYYSDFVEADTEAEAMDEFQDFVLNAKRSEFIWEVQECQRNGDDQ